MGIAAFGFQNLVLSGTLTAGSEQTGLPVSNLQEETGSPSLAWQTAASVVTAAAGAKVTITPSSRQTWRAFGLFRTNLTSAAAVRFKLYDSPSTLVVEVDVSGPSPGYMQCVGLLDADTAADFCTIEIDDSANPDSFINVPLAYAGPIWVPVSGPAYDTTVGRDSQTVEVTTRGGQEFPNFQWQRRRWNISLQGLRQSEISQALDLDRLGQAGSNVLYIPDMTSPGSFGTDVIYGRLTSLADVAYPYGAADRRSWRAQITERL